VEVFTIMLYYNIYIIICLFLLCIHDDVNNEIYAITKLLVVIFTEKDVVWNFESQLIDLTPKFEYI